MAHSRICIVTPDVLGPIRNGGIGTHCARLARSLVALRNDVTLLFTGDFETKDAAYFVEKFSREGIRFVPIGSLPDPNYTFFPQDSFVRQASRVARYLKDERFDTVHFQDWRANGYLAIQAKRTANQFQDSQLVVMMHSPSEWINEGMKTWGETQPLYQAKLNFLERYCCEHADLLISPSEYMFRWAIDRGWTLASRRSVISYLPDASVGEKQTATSASEGEHLAFFGRLETRKGLEIFCAALDTLVSRNTPTKVREISFVGKEGRAEGESALSFIRRHVPRWADQGLKITIQSRLDSSSAIRYLRETGAVAFLPSLSDNSPFAVIECIEHGIPYFAADTGGITELADSRVLFAPTTAGVLSAIERIGQDSLPLRHPYSGAAARTGWNELHTRKMPETIQENILYEPLVSVCIAHFNHGAFLSQLLESLAVSDHPNYQVVVVDDGSTCLASKHILPELKARYSKRGWKFLSTPNSGIGATRNYAAANADGELIIFMDADNIATPHMISSFVEAMRREEFDCLTCHCLAFEGDNPPSPDFSPVYAYLPMGPCLEAGALENVFGDANFCIRKRVFVASGGFAEERGTSYEDWEFLAALCIKGGKLDVIPSELFHYRYTKEGFSRTTNAIENHWRALRGFSCNQDPYVGRLLRHVVAPLHFQNLRLSHEVAELREIKQAPFTWAMRKLHQRLSNTRLSPIVRLLHASLALRWLVKLPDRIVFGTLRALCLFWRGFLTGPT